MSKCLTSVTRRILRSYCHIFISLGKTRDLFCLRPLHVMRNSLRQIYCWKTRNSEAKCRDAGSQHYSINTDQLQKGKNKGIWRNFKTIYFRTRQDAALITSDDSGDKNTRKNQTLFTRNYYVLARLCLRIKMQHKIAIYRRLTTCLKVQHSSSHWEGKSRIKIIRANNIRLN